MTLLPGVTSYFTTIETRLRNSNYKFWRSLLVILTSSSIFIAINGCLKTFFSFYLYGVPVSYQLIMATFLVIYSVYGLNKITDTEEDQLNAPERSNLISSHQKLFTYSSFIAYILAVIIGILHGWQVILVLLFPLLAGVIYSIQVHPRIPRLKDIFAVKSLVVALSWTVGNTFLPLVNYNSNLLVMSLIFYFFFIKSFINTVLFDLMDVDGDKLTGAMTIPVVIGASCTIKLLLLLNTTLLFFIYLVMAFDLFSVLIIPLIFCVIYGYAYILYFSGTKNRLQMDILVDGEWILVVFISLLSMGI
ncbi:MAG: UbiA family prenyltransferase [Methanobacterium sp.]|uniref:Prenyltransferase n=1 Tax=Methanobacterium subterraneum TaxID=59277 RepID=A0A2H4VPI7_9EURY|nr:MULTISPECIES: UbiA family prenyltransferase [Methanobacterium]AUB58984.1 prenyltransferase [Methanobacterium sp. MZ-A1]AUB59986.1 prenyltransferase [Methanobacterium subterraneum]MBW4257689.1 UbiA family prenyltransferase [Methanobacterium sp. YSL]MCC7560794.1 UbiA family prenyltransferase [Methanobacterium sp.]